jgi:hypothetical protein
MEATFSLLIMAILTCASSVRLVLILGRCRTRGFSKTARLHRDPRHLRPHGRQLDAMRRHDRSMPGAVARRGLTDDLAERATEGAQAGEADVEADVGDAPFGLPQQEHRALYPPPLQVAVGRLPEDRTEAADEMGLRDVRHRGDRPDVQWFGIRAIHRVAGAQQAPVEILDFPAHGATLRHEKAGERIAPIARQGR